MGNLLGSPITEKDTHVGTTHDSNVVGSENNSESTSAAYSSSPDGGGLQYGISSMQGWRIHMEDAHIAQPFLYAEQLLTNNDGGGSGGDDDSFSSKKTTAIEATLSKQQDENDVMTKVEVTDDKSTADNTSNDNSNSKNSSNNNNNQKHLRIPLPNHSLFAVFDGHGGSFAAEYASRNLLRVLCRSTTFCDYAKKWRGREGYLLGLQEELLEKMKTEGTTTTTASTIAASSTAADNETPEKQQLDDDKQRLQQLQKRGRESDEKVKQIKEQVKRHFDGEMNIAIDNDDGGQEDAAAASSNANTTPTSSMIDNQELQVARATYDHELMTLLEHSLRDAFIDLDAEILREVRGDKVEEANTPYGRGYDLSMHTLEGCIGHLPKEASNAGGEADDVAMTASSTQQTDDNGGNNDGDKDDDHPTPSEDEDAGTTAVVVLTTPKWIVCANSGDSRSVYSRSNHRAVPLSYDHKPEDEDEERRIREAGGYVSGGRVEGDLAVSRGLGDYRFKDLDAVMSGSRGESVRRSTSILQRQIASSLQGGQEEEEDVPMFKPSEQKVSPVPDIIVQNRDSKEDEFIIIACDGIWDVQTNQECVRMVADIFAEGEGDLGLVCEEVLDQCLIKGSKDNMTAAVIKFPKQVIGNGGGVVARRERRGAAASSSSGGANDGENDNGEGGEQLLRRVYNPYVPPAQRGEGEKK